jgi:DNA polymerase/3'-5' exonuclease PolX
MSATATRIPFAEATAIADELLELLRPSCERIAVAGSIRRGIQTIGDLDLLCVPKLTPTTIEDMFGERPGPDIDLLHAAIHDLYMREAIEQRLDKNGRPSSWGPKAKRAVFRGLSVDVNTVEASTFGVWMVIKTGPHQFSQALVTPKGQKAAIRNREGKVTQYRDGLLPEGLSFGGSYQLYRGDERIETPEEADVFNAYSMAWREPQERR